MTMAFSEYKIKKWPFDGPILITETNTMDEKSVSYIVDSWCYLGNCEDEFSCDVSKEYIFDLDMYKILVQFVKNPANYKKIKTISLSFVTNKVSYDGV
jgi:hypothetical protein